jgi:hypothetical protein
MHRPPGEQAPQLAPKIEHVPPQHVCTPRKAPRVVRTPYRSCPLRRAPRVAPARLSGAVALYGFM